MKKHIRILPILLIFTIILTGCGFGGGAQHEEEKLPTLNAADWPTPPASVAQASPTPFPKVTLVPTARPVVTKTDTTASVEDPGSEGRRSDGSEVTVDNETETLTDQTPAQPEGPTIAATALVAAAEVTLREEPSTAASTISQLPRNEPVGILAKSAGDDWVYVITLSLQHGWLPTDSLRIIGSLAEAPVLPFDNTMAANTAEATTPPASDSLSGDESANNTATRVQPLTAGNLAPVTTARITSEALNMRQGPGANYEPLGVLSGGQEVAVLALNATREWALVETPNPGLAWVSLDHIAVEGSLADVPRVISSAPSRDLPPGQIAPIFNPSTREPIPVKSNGLSDDASGAVLGTTSRTQADNSVAQTQQASASIAQPPQVPVLADLTPLATAHINTRELDLQQGPGTAYGPMGVVSVDDTLSILALNQQGDWALVQSIDQGPAWVSLDRLNVDSSLESAPQILTAWVDSNEVTVQRGPGIFYEPIGTLAINDLVAVLGMSESESWLLVKPVMGGGQGWVARHFLTINGPLTDVPQVAGPPLVEDSISGSQAATAPVKPGTTGSGKLVFQLSSGGQIMVINPDGSGLRTLTHGIDPALSPDGQTVAFTRWAGDDGTLWLINVDGTNERAILGETKQAKGPAWSPDGSRIVLNFQNGGRLDKKKVCENLIKLGGNRPDIPWNVDPDDIGVEFQDGIPFLCWKLPPDPFWGLRVVNLADGSFEDLYGGLYAFRPTWDPGRDWRIVADAGNGLLETDVNREYAQNITNIIGDGSPVFSPDGRYLAVSVDQSGSHDIYRLNSDGSGRVQLTKTPLWVTAEPGDHKPWNNVSPAWSPDGSQIAFLTDRDGRWEIWVMNADGSDQGPMFSDEINDQLTFTYDFVDERVLSWR
jgi:uncharacterized protein YgiM (DUF1202 family)